MTELKITKGSANVFEDLGFGAPESQNLLLRSQTMVVLVQWFNASGLTQAAAAKILGVTQPRFNQLLKGKIEVFSLDALVNMATSAGMRVGLNIRPQTSVKVRHTSSVKVAQATRLRPGHVAVAPEFNPSPVGAHPRGRRARETPT